MCRVSQIMNNHSDIQNENSEREMKESPSRRNVPKWLEDITDAARKKRPGSFRISEEPNTAPETREGTPSRNDLSSSSSGLSEVLDGGRSSSRESDIFNLPRRDGSARHGRRAVVTVGSRSEGSSPRKSPPEERSGPETFLASEERSASSKSARRSEGLFSPFPYVPSVESPADGRRSRAEKQLLERDRRELSLEESWSSLSFFDRRHKGRLTDKHDELLRTESPVLDGIQETDGSGSPSLEKNAAPDFIIPELPAGKHLIMNIRSTWGDRHYLGLNGIEIFSSSGEPVAVSKIWADPADINVLPEYSKDPRVVKNLLDGVNRTHDDMHLWLAPFTPGKNHVVQMIFQNKVQVAMIRIWNYNKSRIHSYRGVRDVEMTLDGVTVFVGEIARASGEIVGGAESFGDTILFTTDENILESISQFDCSFSFTLKTGVPEVASREVERPITAYNGDVRPFTCAGPSHVSVSENYAGALLDGQKLELHLLTNWGHPALIGLTGFEIIGEDGLAVLVEQHYLGCNSFSPDIYRLIDGINLTTDENHMWETGFLESEPVIITVTFPSPRRIAGLRMWNYNGSPDLVYCGVKLLAVHLDGQVVTGGSQGIATVRRAPGNCHFNFVQDIYFVEELQFDIAVESENKVSPIKHSYSDQDVNAYLLASSASSTPRGDALPALSSGDGGHIGPASLALSPRGSASHFLFEGDEIAGRLANGKSGRSSSRRNSGDAEYESPAMPQGFVFQLLVLSTWGDMYYVGLNGLELYDEDGVNIKLTENNIGAYPESVNILEGISNDVRTPDKLVDGVNDTMDGCHMWLAPILPNELNRVYIVFDYPVTVSMIKLWNYSKTPNRGVKEFGILVDDLLVYNGVLDRASHATNKVKVPYRTVLFTSDKELRRQEHNTQVRNSSYGHHVQLLNDQQRITSGGSSCYSADQSQRPLTSLVPNSRSKSLHNL